MFSRFTKSRFTFSRHSYMSFLVLGRFPVTSSNRHFIFCDTSYQREKWSLHTRYFTLVHYIPCGTSYQSHFIPVHFIRLSSYQGHSIPVTSYYASLHTEATSYQCISSRGHFISVHFKPKSPHTQVTSYRSHFIPKSLHTEVTSYYSFHAGHLKIYFLKIHDPGGKYTVWS